jgi:hypothetical protein
MVDGEFVHRPYIYLLKRLLVYVNLVHKFSPFSMDMKHLPELCWNDLLSCFSFSFEIIVPVSTKSRQPIEKR